MTLCGKREPVWMGRWREDIIQPDGTIKRVLRNQLLGTKKEFPTKKLAPRELETRLSPINSVSYRARRTATFAEFARIWQDNALTQHKPSTQTAIRSQLRKWLLPYFGSIAMREIGGQALQMFIQSSKLAPKSCRNFILTLRMMWKSAKAWGYVAHDPFDGLVLPKVGRQARFFFTVDEIQRILAVAPEPYRTFYWIAAEAGLRAGELCGLSIADLDLDSRVVNVKRAVWRGKIQTPKTVNAVRQFAISSWLAAHLRAFLRSWRPNSNGLLFATSNGTPWDQNLVVKRKLHPLLASLEIKRCGLHAFRHTNGSLMDRLNAPMKLRQERLGHAPGSDITLSVYTHTVGEDDRLLAEKLGEILNRNVPKIAGEEVLLQKECLTVQ